jgi:putative ABC transport system permease protein
VTATVAGAVALGVGGASDTLQSKTTYQPTGPSHAVVVGGLNGATPTQLRSIRAAVAKRLPGAAQVPIRTIQSSKFLDVTDGRSETPLLSSYGGVVDGGAMVGDSALDLLDLSAAERAKAADGLRRTGAVALVDSPSQGPVSVAEHDDTGNLVKRSTLPAYRVVSALHPTPLIVSEAVGATLGRVGLAGLLVKGDLSKDDQQRLNEELSGIGTGYASVERGWTGSDDQRLAMLVLGGTAAVLVLGGTLSAALLALSDARPDFATLMAVGAPPRVRRRVAAGYAAVIGLLGSLLGTIAGLAPGIAVSFPLTRGNPEGFASHYLDIPWTLLAGLALVVPLTAALGAALLTRSRLPLAARVET